MKKQNNNVAFLVMMTAIMIAMLGVLFVSCAHTDSPSSSISTTTKESESSTFPESSQTESETKTADFPSSTDTGKENNDDEFDGMPTIWGDSIKVKPNSQEVEVKVYVSNNPCILGMDFAISYDEDCMMLKRIESKIASDGVNFTSPAYYRNPTTVVWDFQDATWKSDGEILSLYFDILPTASEGFYEIGILYSYGNIYDEMGKPIDIHIKNGIIEIKD